MRTIDRYLIREILPPFFLALGLFTFVLAIRPMLEYAGQLLAKGVPIHTVGFLLMSLLPQSLGVTIPMALLAGLLMGLGRLSADREGMALLACGVSPMRLLWPVMAFSVAVAGVDLYVMIAGVPDGNQAFREASYKLLAKSTESDIKPGLFYERFPGRVLLVQAARPEGGWSGVFLADTTQPGRPSVTLAEKARFVLDESRHEVNFYLDNSRRYIPGADPHIYDLTLNNDPKRQLVMTIRADEVFGTGTIDRGLPEMRISDLQALIAQQRAAGVSPHNAILYLHQKFSFPMACVVFGLVAVALGLHTRREGKLAGMVMGLVVVTLYYGVMQIAESLTRGHLFPAAFARWLPNIVIGAAGLIALSWRRRAAGADLAVPMPAFLERWLFPRPASAATQTEAAAPAPKRVVLVIRIPQFELPRPRLLDLYVASRYLRMACLAFLGLLTLYYIGTMLDLSDKVLKHQATFAVLLEYLWESTPQFVVYVAPLATLVAVLGTIGALTRSSELTVMRACGISLYRVALPLMAMALLWSGLLYLLQEDVLGRANQRADVLSDQLHGREAHTVTFENRNWLASGDGRIFYYREFRPMPGRESLADVSIFQTASGPYRLASHTFATRAVASGGTWQSLAGWQQRFDARDRSTRQEFGARPIDLPPPSSFTAAQVNPDLMSMAELREHIRHLSASGFSVAEERVKLHSRIAFPLVTLVMTILAVPFGVTIGRHGALYGMGLAMGLGFMHFLLAYFFMATGTAGVLPPALAAWAADLLFLAIALYLLLTVKT